MTDHVERLDLGRILESPAAEGGRRGDFESADVLDVIPHIQEVQVFGVPDEKYGEQVCAWIRVREGMELSEQDVKSYCSDRIAHFKVPHYVRFVTGFPMTVTGKAQKFKMREEMAQLLGVVIKI